jgi:hypothetical protein
MEDGLKQVKYHMAHFPPTIEKLLEDYEVVAAGDTGPDPREVAARMKLIRRKYKKTLTLLEKHDSADRRTIKPRSDHANKLMELKLSPKCIYV